jgi:hypothetical protein
MAGETGGHVYRISHPSRSANPNLALGVVGFCKPSNLLRASVTSCVSPRPPLIAGSVSCYLILQPAALLLLPDLCNSILLVADNSRQLNDVMMVSSCSVSTLMEYAFRSLHNASHSSTPRTVPFKQSSDHIITPSAAVHQHEREGRVPLIVVEFQQSLAHWSLSGSLCGPQSR